MKLLPFFLVAGALAAATACGGEKSPASGAIVEEKSGLTAVRLIGERATLDRIAHAAAQARWRESRYDAKGRLVLTAPPNYTPDDFGRLLQAIDPYKSDIEGLQMLGPHGGIVDGNGIEHPDD